MLLINLLWRIPNLSLNHFLSHYGKFYALKLYFVVYVVIRLHEREAISVL